MSFIYRYFFGTEKPKRHYGCNRDRYTEETMNLRPELTNYKKIVHHPCLSTIIGVDLRNKCPPVFDQGHLGSCTANAICGAYGYEMMKQRKSYIPMSRLFLYYEERDMESTVATDSGAQLKDGVLIIGSPNKGVCLESLWPYDITKFAVKPPQLCYDEAEHNYVVKYERVEPSIENIKQSLLDGFPVIFGFKVFESFESQSTASTGIMTMPVDGEKMLGGHAVVVVGFDDNKKMFIVRNSWGEQWGENGYFYMPYQYMTTPDYTFDYWTLQFVYDS